MKDAPTTPEVAEPIVVICPDWCERGDEHCDANDRDHWTHSRDVTGSLYADLHVDGGCSLFTLHAGDHVEITFQRRDAAKLISVLGELLSLDAWSDLTKRTVLDG